MRQKIESRWARVSIPGHKTSRMKSGPLRGIVIFCCCLTAVSLRSIQGRAEDGVDLKSKPIAAAILKFQDRTESKAVAEKVGDLLAADMAGIPELLFVERDDIDRILKEHLLNISGAVNGDDSVRIGRLTGARLLITGSVIDTGNERYVVAKIIGTETSRVLGVSTKGKIDDGLGELTRKLSEEIANVVREKGASILPVAENRDDRVGKLKKALQDQPKPTVIVKVTESHSGLPKVDPAAQTELLLWCQELGLKTIDPAVGNESDADFVISGEGLAEFANRRDNLVSVRARVEVKAVNRKTGEVVAVDRQMVRIVDTTEVLAGKEGLQLAAADVAERLLPKLVRSEQPKKKKK